MRHNLAGGRHGMTIIEMLVAMVVLTILGASITAIMINQIKSSTSIQGQTMVQSDVNLALSMMRADLSQAGYGLASEEQAAQSTAPAGVGDNLSLTGSNLGGGGGRWTVVTESNVTSGTITEVNVNRWSGPDSVNNIKEGDSIKVISGLKQLVGTSKVPIGGVSHQSATLDKLTINPGLSISQGSLITQVNLTGQAVYTLNTATHQLLRNGIPFMDNIEQFKVRYFWDRDSSGTIDSLTGEWSDILTVNVSPAQWNARPLMIGVAFVTVSPTQEKNVVDPRASYTIWSSVFNITGTLNRRYRNFYSLYARPRNVGG